MGEALRTKAPVMVDAIVDPFAPPMPPKGTPVQAEKLGTAMAIGTPNRAEIALTIPSDKVRELV